MFAFHRRTFQIANTAVMLIAKLIWRTVYQYSYSSINNNNNNYINTC